MCRNIKPLFNYDPLATDAEIHDAALQFVRKLSGSNKPSRVNEKAFNVAVENVSLAIKTLLTTMTTSTKPKNREKEKQHTRAKAIFRFGTKTI